MSTSPIDKAGSKPLGAATAEPAKKAPKRTTAEPAIRRDGLSLREGSPGSSFPDFTAARQWRPGSSLISGVEANQAITGSYEDLDQRMTKYLGKGALPNWTTFGKFASRTAGQSIVELEGIIRAADGHEAASILAIASDALKQPLKRASQARVLLQNLHRGPDFLKNVKALRQALVYGNTEIIKDIGPAFDTFLSAEAAGRDGLAALRAKGYGRAPKDPQNFLLQAFEKYAEAKKVGQEIQTLQDKLKRAGKAEPDQEAINDGGRLCSLQDLQRKLMVSANLLIGFHEQYLSLQRPEMFDDPALTKLMAGLTREMVIHDANGAHPLLRSGGNWANFADRMGLAEARPQDPPESVFTLRDANGQAQRFIVKDVSGDTIAGYFHSFTNYGNDAMRLLNRGPQSLKEDLEVPLVERLTRKLAWNYRR